MQYVTEDGRVVLSPLNDADGSVIARGAPVRLPPSYPGQRHYPGLFWSSTNRAHVVYESRLELAWLWLADFDPTVSRLAAQPFLLTGIAGDRRRQRYPDFLYLTVDGRPPGVVDVKAPGLAHRPEVAESLAWTAGVVRDRGWTYEVWTGADEVVLRNVLFLAAARRPGLVDEASLVAAVDACRADLVTFERLEDRLANLPGTASPRAAVLGALWSGRLRCDLSRPIAPTTNLRAAA